MNASPTNGDIVERFTTFDCNADACVGVVTTPSSRPPGTPGVVVIVGGPQYRVGSHRQFVALSRALAGAGYASIRFDCRGMGDSDGGLRSFESIDDDIDAAVEALKRESGVDRVVLWGLCDGASAALMHGTRNASVAGVIALNPWARQPATEAAVRLRHYYVSRLLSREFWSKLLGGRLDPRASLRDLSGAVAANVGSTRAAPPPFLARMHAGWCASRLPMLFVLSGRDLTAREFETWVNADRRRRGRLASADCAIERLPDADHTFSTADARDRVTRRTLEWLQALR